ncbi:MAG: hypothetical protein WCZ28_06240 [Burkholderiaceae bacterium]
MVRKAELTNSFTKGVLDPALSERIDLKHYYDSLAEAKNLEARPQGGIRRRAGWSLLSDADVVNAGYKRRLRRRIEPIHVTAGMITAHNGGTTANLVDQDPETVFTTSAAGAGTFVVLEVDLGAPRDVCFFDVIGFYAGTAGKDDVLAVEYWDGSAWIEMQGAIEPELGTRRNIRSTGLTPLADVAVATTAHIEIAGDPIIDGVQVGDGTRVLVKNQNDPTTNGIYTVSFGGSSFTWARASDADSASEIYRSIVAVTGGNVNGGTRWANLGPQPAGDFADWPKLYERVDQLGRTRRFGEWPGGPAGQPVAAQNWRVVAKGAQGIGTVNVAGIRLWTEKRQLSPVKMFNFHRSADLVLELVLTERNIDVFQRQRYLASIPVPIAAHQIADVNAAASLDTVLLFHEDVPTVRIVRQGANDEWNVETAPFGDVPGLTAGTAFSGDEDEVKELTLSGIEENDAFVLWLGDMVTAPVTYTGTAGLAAAVASALDALPGVQGSDLVVTLTAGAAPGVRVQFSGTNGGRAWPALTAQVLGRDDIEPLLRIVQRGLNAEGPLFGGTTGWPRCGGFVQSRLLLGGFRAAPQTWGVSRVADYFDFTSTGDPLTADLGFFRTLDTDSVETIREAFVGTHLQLLTDSSAWYIEARTLDATQPQNAVRAVGYGIEAAVPPAIADDGTLFIQKGGRVLRDLKLGLVDTDGRATYQAEPLSLLAPHLLTQVVDMAHRPPLSTSEGNLVFMAQADGSLVLLVLLRAQEVIAFFPHGTDGKFRAITATTDFRVVAAIERESADGADLYLETRDEAGLLDAATHFTFDTPQTVIGHLGHLEGKAVWAYADGELMGPLTVTGAAITLDTAATDVTVGLAPQVSGRLQKFREKLANDRPFRLPARIYEVELSLVRTGQIEISVTRGPWHEIQWGPWQEAPLTYMDGDALDPGQLSESGGPELPMMQRLLTGDVRRQNFRGWSRHPSIQFRQSVPAPLEIKAIRFEVAHHG